MTQEISELGARILSELFEAHAENVASAINTVITPTGARTELSEFLSAIAGLVASDFVVIAYENIQTGKLVGISKEESLEVVKAISSNLTFSAAEANWLWNETLPWPEILATAAGLVQAERLLGEKGYRWWRRVTEF